MEIQFKTGLPIAFTKTDGKRIFGRILCNIAEDKENIRCVTPHGSIFSVKKDESILQLNQEDEAKLKQLESSAVESYGIAYNSLLDFMDSEEDLEVK